ncbi:DEKNAAC103953 [Brettanomyces naardenensis]|uniref:DEKNAAC103953 n=1 Tax=Brettanomyces naardenensis TaxID=13370 RepID=A0A448YPL0_BRENA|nr:DEKNAAC103953 [Brettanomyces naardenensis]
MDHPAWALGTLSLVGGIAGYARKGSVPSITAGTALAVLYYTAGYLLHENKEYGIHTALLASSITLFAGVGRAASSSIRKPVPLALTTVGTISTLYFAKKYSEFYL